MLAYRLDEYSRERKSGQALQVFKELGQHLPELKETVSQITSRKKL
jgi:hypothetical protein